MPISSEIGILRFVYNMCTNLKITVNSAQPIALGCASYGWLSDANICQWLRGLYGLSFPWLPLDLSLTRSGLSKRCVLGHDSWGHQTLPSCTGFSRQNQTFWLVRHLVCKKQTHLILARSVSAFASTQHGLFYPRVLVLSWASEIQFFHGHFLSVRFW